MIIGTVRPEEARVEDSRKGYHPFKNDEFETIGSFEVFWDGPECRMAPPNDLNMVADQPKSGWYWWPCFPGCLPDGEAQGPFASSIDAYYDAQDF